MKARFSLLFAVLTLCGCLTPKVPESPSVVTSPVFKPETFQRVAVFVQNRSPVKLNIGTLAVVENIFTKECISKKYLVASRSDVHAALREIAFQNSGLTEQVIAEKAKLMAVDAILLVSVEDVSARGASTIIRVEGSYFAKWRVSLSAKLLSADKGEVLLLADHSKEQYMDNGEDLEKLIAELAQIVASAIPGQS